MPWQSFVTQEDYTFAQNRIVANLRFRCSVCGYGPVGTIRIEKTGWEKKKPKEAVLVAYHTCCSFETPIRICWFPKAFQILWVFCPSWSASAREHIVKWSDLQSHRTKKCVLESLRVGNQYFRSSTCWLNQIKNPIFPRFLANPVA